MAFEPFPDLPGWTYRIEEFSPGGYRLDAVHFDGRSVSRQGSNPDALLNECRADIGAMPEKRHA
jgi:hypothetical protein